MERTRYTASFISAGAKQICNTTQVYSLYITGIMHVTQQFMAQFKVLSKNKIIGFPLHHPDGIKKISG
jgi:hypothetical protein